MIVMDSQPKVADTRPTVIELKAGQTYYWCSCGHSKSQPFCDSSHKHAGTSLAPLGFTPETDRKVALCLCKHTKSSPFCDGSHRNCQKS